MLINVHIELCINHIAQSQTFMQTREALLYRAYVYSVLNVSLALIFCRVAQT